MPEQDTPASSTPVARNLSVLRIFRALQMSLFPQAIITLYQGYQLGLSWDKITLLQAIASFTVAIGEFPAGYLCDKIGSRRIMQCAALIMMASWLVYIQATPSTFSLVVAAEILRGIGWALISGADESILYESLLACGREQDYTRSCGRIRYTGQISEAICALASGPLYAFCPQLPLALAAAVWCANAVVAQFLREPPTLRAQAKAAHTMMKEILFGSIRRSPILRVALPLSLVLGLASYINVWIIPLLAHQRGLPEEWLGVMWTVANLFVAAGYALSHRLKDRFGAIPPLALCLAMVAVAYAGLAFWSGMWVFLFYFLLTFERGLNYPILSHIIQRELPSSWRTSLLSVASLLFRLVSGGIFLGASLLTSRAGGIASFHIMAGLTLTLLGLSFLLRLRHRLPPETSGEKPATLPPSG